MDDSFAHILLRASDAAVRACLKEARAHIAATQDGFVRVQLELIDEDTLQALALELSRCTGSLALAVLGQEEVRLVLALYDKGQWLDYYDSNPMYMGCRVCSYAETSINAEGGNAQNLAAAFGVPERARALGHWLVRRRGLGFMREAERYGAIAEILGIPQSLVPQARA